MTDETASPCTHELLVPLQLYTEEESWIHWCSVCGSISSESGDVTSPKGPWFAPGDLTPEHIARINRAARGE